MSKSIFLISFGEHEWCDDTVYFTSVNRFPQIAKGHGPLKPILMTLTNLSILAYRQMCQTVGGLSAFFRDNAEKRCVCLL
mgnify:CR=1 FL=1